MNSISPIIDTRRKISPTEFVKIWRGEYISNSGYKDFYKKITEHLGGLREDPNSSDYLVTFQDCDVEGDVKIVNSNVKLPYLVLKNTTAGIFHLENVVSQTITISNNSKTGGFWIQNSKLYGFDIEDNSQTGYFMISNQSIVGNFKILNNSKTDGFFIEGMSKVGNFRLESSTISSLSIQHSCMGNFNVLNNSNSNISSINISDSQTGFFILRHVITTHLTISYSSIDKFYIKNGAIASFSVNSSQISNLEISDNTFVERFYYLPKSGSIPQISLNNCKIRHLDFKDCVFPELMRLQVSDCHVNRISLVGLCNFGSLFFINLKPLFSSPSFQKNEQGQYFLDKNGNYTLKDTTEESIIIIQNSDLGKTLFINCDLNAFHHFEYANAKMLDVFVAGSQMPNESKFLISRGNHDFWEQKRLAYAQFKKIYENRGDTISALRYQANELESYRILLEKERKTSNYRYSKNWWHNIGESLTLCLNRYSSNYGNDWYKGVFWTLVSTIICFSVYCHLIGFRYGTNYEMFWELVGYSIQYLNPLRDSDSQPFKDSIVDAVKNYPIQIGTGARIWDYFSRIIVAYFVYQTIQAFRKFGKSNG